MKPATAPMIGPTKYAQRFEYSPLATAGPKALAEFRAPPVKRPDASIENIRVKPIARAARPGGALPLTAVEWTAKARKKVKNGLDAGSDHGVATDG